jgi:hypothetical protein
MKTWRKFTKLSTKQMRYYFGDHWQVTPLVWNMPVNSIRGLEHAADLREVCASAAD